MSLLSRYLAHRARVESDRAWLATHEPPSRLDVADGGPRPAIPEQRTPSGLHQTTSDLRRPRRAVGESSPMD